MFQDLLVSTTLSHDDTLNLFTYAVLRLTPHVLNAGTNSWSYLRKSNTASHVTGSILGNFGYPTEDIYGSRDTSPVGNGQRYQVPRPLQRGKWSKGKDGFLVADIWGTEMGQLSPATANMWLQQMEERMYLCVYQHKNLTVILLIPYSSMMKGEQGLSTVKQQILENAAVKIIEVEEKLTRGCGGENAYHVAGYRYLLFDSDRNISRASPPVKVTTLMKDSLLALSKLREEVDLQKHRAKQDEPGHENDLEICIRAKNNAWVIARLTRGNEL
ncbi:hypothetical protein MKX01_030649 [Papaver californicum]|nr:hypothetical protein MKX01_030649 [Papaver californicum]